MANHQVLGYIPGTTFIHRINGTAKMIFLILGTISCMTTYDTRFLIGMLLFSAALFKWSKIKWSQISFVVTFIIAFSLLNLVAVYVFSPEYGVEIYGSRTIIFEGIGRFTLTQEQLFYEVNLLLKYCCTIPLVLIFLLTTNPSEFASSLNKLGLSYKICYSVALAIRYIPDIQEDFFDISLAQQARGFEMSKKAKLFQRIKGTTQIVLPLILSSLDRIEVISTAMELRRFGEKKNRTWYMEQSFEKKDIIVIILAICIMIASFSLFWVNHGRFYNPF